jgi:hemolysin-activating ACP:hemolysin acyltransferase
MFGRTKSKAGDAPAAAEPPSADNSSRREQAPPAAAGAEGSVTAAPPADPAARRRAAIAVRHSLAFAQIVSVLMRSPQHSRYPIAALQWLVLPPLLTGQFGVAEARSKQGGAAAPIAVALWARVSPEVDKRLSENLDKPVQLRPREWRSGDILWLVEAVGDQRALPPFLKRLGETVFKGRDVKVRRRGADGKVSVATLAALAAAG